MPSRFIATAWPGEYGPNVVMHFFSAKCWRRSAKKPSAAVRATV